MTDYYKAFLFTGARQFTNMGKRRNYPMDLQKTINSERRVALQKDAKYIHIMKYMGSKRELLPDIEVEIKKIARKNEGVLDLFAGTGSVGTYLRDDFNIISNDIQEYSSTITKALIVSNNNELSFDLNHALLKIHKLFFENKNALWSIFPKTIKASKEFVSIPKRAWSDSQRKQYIDFLETFPSPLNQFKGGSAEQKSLFKMFKERSEDVGKFPYMQTSFLFAETYFSFEQTIDLDSLRYAIDKVFTDDSEKSIGLSALLYAHSYCSSGTGHFAMFRDLKDVKSINDVFLYRCRDVWELFEKKFREIVEFHKPDTNKNHISISRDFEEVLKDQELAKKYKVIYADPPYSFVHYSRFYHATESLVKYDYMLPEFKGRYRTDRHQSPFCQGQNVDRAFKALFDSASQNKKKILLSYSDTGMIPLAKIIELITEAGMTFSLKELNYDHSTMGREGHKNNTIKEYLISILPSNSN